MNRRIAVLLLASALGCAEEADKTDASTTADATTLADAALPDAESTPDAGVVDTGIAPDSGEVDAGDLPDSGQLPDSGAPELCAATPVPCQDESIQQMFLFTSPNTGAITEEGTTAGEFTTHIDATAGGLEPTRSFVYAKFTPTGLQRVSVGDEAAFESMDWDIAFRRYVIRLNSGVSGPSCVTAARTAPSVTFDTLTSVPSDLVYRTEEYFLGETCEYVADTSGIGAPATALSSFWEYPGCVKMTGNVYVAALRDGRHVKLQVLSYYGTNQANCDNNGAPGSGSANLRVRWAFLD